MCRLMTFGRARRIFPGNLGLSIAAVALALCLAPVSASAAVSGPQLLTFGDYETGTEISTQYEGQGVVFKDESGFYPEIRWDESAYTNPVLSGTFGFGSPISAEFVVPGTTTPATVENLAMDVGYINEAGSTKLTVERTSGPTTLYADEEGFNRLGLAADGSTASPSNSSPKSRRAGPSTTSNTRSPLRRRLYRRRRLRRQPRAVRRIQVFDSRGSGEDKGISKPGSDFITGLLQRFRL